MTSRQPKPEPEVRDGRHATACPDCGAYLQWAVVGIETMLRCPWTTSDRWSLNGHTIPKQLYCTKPLSGSRVIGGMGVQSVR